MKKQAANQDNGQAQKKQNYFEKQRSLSLQCGMHSINHLLKRQAYTVKEMEDICYELSDDFVNPHKHVFGGDYDANVIIIGLQRQGYQCEWVDKRKDFKLDNYLNKNETLGFLVNIPMPKKFYHRVLRFSSRHWLAIRPYNGQKQFALCDSNEQQIKIIKTHQKLEAYLKDAFKNEGQIIWVHKLNK